MSSVQQQKTIQAVMQDFQERFQRCAMRCQDVARVSVHAAVGAAVGAACCCYCCCEGRNKAGGEGGAGVVGIMDWRAARLAGGRAVAGVVGVGKELAVVREAGSLGTEADAFGGDGKGMR